jgi:hypothetical protein
MLGSITPLGERARQQRWSVTFISHVLGATAGGAAFGAFLGFVGAPLVELLAGLSNLLPLAALVGAMGAGLLIDLHISRFGLPTVHRQVRQDWLTSYRGWVYGAGFGVQLGIGVATVVVTSTVYTCLLGAALSGSATRGCLIGGTFGLCRGLTLVSVARVTASQRLAALDRRLAQWASRSRRLVIAAQMALLAVALMFLSANGG